MHTFQPAVDLLHGRNRVQLWLANVWTWAKIYHERSKHAKPTFGDAFDKIKQRDKASITWLILTFA